MLESNTPGIDQATYKRTWVIGLIASSHPNDKPRSKPGCYKIGALFSGLRFAQNVRFDEFISGIDHPKWTMPEINLIIQQKMKVERQIIWWDKGSDTLVGETNIDHIPFENLQALFHPPTEDPLMYNQYKIDLLQIQDLQRWVALPFDFDLYSYFVECWRLD